MLKNKKYRAVITLLILLLFIGCKKEISLNPIENEGTEKKLKYAKRFKIWKLDNGITKVIDGLNNVLILVPHGVAVPEKYKNETILFTPIKNVLITSTTQACHFKAFNELSRISAVTTKEKDWQIKEVVELMKEGKINYFGESSACDFEKISLSRPELVFVSSGNQGLLAITTKLRELHIKYTAIDDYMESHPLGRMEWIKYFAPFVAKEEEADRIFNDADMKIEELIKNNSGKVKPKIAWGMLYNGKVYIAKPGSYAEKMIDIAGGEYLFSNQKVPGEGITLEEFYNKLRYADIFIYSSMIHNSPSIDFILTQAPVLKNISCLQKNNVWCFHSDYYQSIDKTDEILYDLNDIFHQYGESKPKHFIKYEK